MDVFRREEGWGGGLVGGRPWAKRSMFVEVEGTTAALTARLIVLRENEQGIR